jgi:2,3-bisphosphoglycerate-independent phosphoglycerate mutase
MPLTRARFTKYQILKANAICELLEQDLDFVLVHVEGVDEVSHDKNSTAKVQAIEDSSEILLKHLLK